MIMMFVMCKCQFTSACVGADLHPLANNDMLTQ